MGGCHKLQWRRGASWPLTFLAGVRLGPGRGRLDFIKLEAARNLTICDVRSEVSCRGEDRPRYPLMRIADWGPGSQGGACKSHTCLPPIPRCMLASFCITWGSPRNLGSSILCSSSQGSQDQADILTLKGSASPFPGPQGDKSQGLSALLLGWDFTPALCCPLVAV